MTRAKQIFFSCVSRSLFSIIFYYIIKWPRKHQDFRVHKNRATEVTLLNHFLDLKNAAPIDPTAKKQAPPATIGYPKCKEYADIPKINTPKAKAIH